MMLKGSGDEAVQGASNGNGKALKFVGEVYFLVVKKLHQRYGLHLFLFLFV